MMNRIEGRQEQNRVFLLQGFCLLCAAIALLIVVYNYRALGDGYGLIILFPVAYAIAFVVTIRSFIACRYMITCLIFTVIEAIRFILMPATIALAGANCGSPSFLVTPQYIQYACICNAHRTGSLLRRARNCCCVVAREIRDSKDERYG